MSESSNGKYKAMVIGVGASVNSQGRKGGGHQIGYTHAEMHKKNPRVELIAGVDINADNLKAFQEKFAVPHGRADYKAAIAELKPDLVSICTYVGLHRPMIEACVAAGVKGIVCEKPFLASPADCVAVRKLMAGTKTKLVVAHPRRYRKAFELASQRIAEGAVGKVRLISTSLNGWDLNEMGAHSFDFVRQMLGDAAIEWAFGQARVRETRGYGHAMEDFAIAHLGFAGGARASIEAGLGKVGEAYSVVGTEGVLHVHGEHAITIQNKQGETRELHDVDPNAIWGADWPRLWDDMLADLIAWIEGGPASRVGFDSAIQTCEAVLATYCSALIGDRVDLPFSPEVVAIAEYPVDLIAKRSKR
jgi:predicted dehydrogenase